MATEEKFLKAIKQLRKTDRKRNFAQSVDLIINLKNFNLRKDAFNLFVQVPNKIKDKKIAGFLEKKSGLVETITKDEFARFGDKKELKKLIKNYDFFIANAKLMPAVATSFGRVLGPVGKMPSPQLGILTSEDETAIKNLIDKINSSVRVRVKEPSIKIAIGKEDLKDEEILKNLLAVYDKILEALPKKGENVKNVLIKFSMDKPVSVGV